MSFTAIVLGGSGLTGHQLLQQLIQDAACTHVRALVRQPLALEDAKLETVVLDFNNDAAFREAMQGEVVFCCIGTTIRKAGSQAAFRAVDYDIPARAAAFAKAQGVQQFLLISAIGAGISSSNFYLRTKGEVERAIQQTGFYGVHIFRPSFLMGQREERRPMEIVAGALLPVVSLFLLGRRLRKYKGIPAAKVARAMIVIAQRKAEGIHVYESDAIAQLGKA
ncbi:Uncharacterized conserved protein YbjT, contains NAD(P)-binding and DUF2867 domains [Chitinophaga costaii]|uniref:Uncharacterized conserved protein YbjT, contains NAD(P)-binding and DUF2867 domains n=1 Tax=Chitinophaga costaii TaxID=1335309 RepID=A0A1C4D9R6_9BACT|nr:NAD(P)H-binding protein [Chitinophaga costaii]PUZ24525.1 nucleoside-diphosphate sugar epimerase [Chitinophaga costaii]SCC28144.1 Uncharacterized conserved protein YbjT, contains NAD(P)-binding and DUF2867 domains [Chitinophaga costaii]